MSRTRLTIIRTAKRLLNALDIKEQHLMMLPI